MRKTRNDSKFKLRLTVLKKKRPSGLRNFKTQVKFKPLHLANLKLLLTATQIRSNLKKLPLSSEHVAAAGLEIELPKFELPGEAQ